VNEAENIGYYPKKLTDHDRTKQAAIWLMQDFAAIDKRISLEGLGLVSFDPVVPANGKYRIFFLQLLGILTKPKHSTYCASC